MAIPLAVLALLTTGGDATGQSGQAGGASCADAAALSMKANIATGVVRLRPNVLMSSAVKRSPIVPPGMLHDTNLHGKVKWENGTDAFSQR
jgi:hypothetical protein